MDNLDTPLIEQSSTAAAAPTDGGSGSAISSQSGGMTGAVLGGSGGDEKHSAASAAVASAPLDTDSVLEYYRSFPTLVSALYLSTIASPLSFHPLSSDERSILDEFAEVWCISEPFSLLCQLSFVLTQAPSSGARSIYFSILHTLLQRITRLMVSCNSQPRSLFVVSSPSSKSLVCFMCCTEKPSVYSRREIYFLFSVGTCTVCVQSTQ